MKRRIILLAIVGVILLIGSAVYIKYGLSPRENLLSYLPNGKDSHYRNVQTKNLSPYAMFGDSSLVLMTEEEEKGIQCLGVQNTNKNSKMSILIFELRTGRVYFLDKKNAITHTAILAPTDLAKFLSVDPLAHKYPEHSPYTYTANNPIRYIDPDGREFTEAAQKWVDRYLKEINSRIANNDAEIRDLHTKLEQGGLSEKEIGRINKSIGKLQTSNSTYEGIKGEVATLAASTQIYDVQIDNSLTSTDLLGNTSDRGVIHFEPSNGYVIIEVDPNG